MYQGFYTLVCIFPRQNTASVGQSVECIKDCTPWPGVSEPNRLAGGHGNHKAELVQNWSKTMVSCSASSPGLRRFPWRPRGPFEIAISLRASSIFLRYPSNVSMILHISLFFLRQNMVSVGQSVERIKDSTHKLAFSFRQTWFCRIIRRTYQGLYTLVCLFLKQNKVSWGQSVECIKDSTPWFAFSLSNTRFFRAIRRMYQGFYTLACLFS